MTTSTATTDVTAIPRIQHDEAMAIAAVENRKFAEQLRSFGPDDWARPTDCALLGRARRWRRTSSAPPRARRRCASSSVRRGPVARSPRRSAGSTGGTA